ncbi:MAG: sugar-binding domain-containing protein, partial [Thermoguttaceae bacterium]
MSPWNGWENDDPAALAATLLHVAKCRRFAAKRPFPYSVLGLTRQAILFRRFAAVLIVCLAFGQGAARTGEPPRGTPVACGPRMRIDLDGSWKFATDPENVGEVREWFAPGKRLPRMPRPGYAASAKGEIRVPGIWDQQGYGTPTDKVHHNFVGKGWYKREVTIPADWAGRRRLLIITGVHRYAKVWIDRHYAGEQIGYLSQFESDVTDYLVPGRTVTVTIQVDSKQRWEVDTMFGTLDLADYMDVAWGGIWGHVYLEARAEASLSQLHVQADVPGSACSASAVFCGKGGLADRARLEVLD